MDLNTAIRIILDGFPDGYTFDAHTVIKVLARDYPDVYQAEGEGYASQAVYHSHISKTIKSLVAIQYPTKNYSFNINDNLSPNALYHG